MTDKPLADQTRPCDGREPRDRRRNREGARRSRRACRPDRAHGRRARGSRRARSIDAGGSATIAPLDLTETDSIARLGAAIGERWPQLDILVLNAATLGTLAAVPAIDAKELAQVLTLNVSAQAGADRGVRSDAAQVEARPGDRHHLERRAEAARLLGRCMARRRRRSKRCSAPMATRWSRSAASAPRSSIPARPAPKCAPAPIRARIRLR